MKSVIFVEFKYAIQNNWSHESPIFSSFRSSESANKSSSYWLKVFSR